MKIALVSPASFPATQFGGIMFLVADIAKEATNLGNDVVIYTTDLDFANNLKTYIIGLILVKFVLFCFSTSVDGNLRVA